MIAVKRDNIEIVKIPAILPDFSRCISIATFSRNEEMVDFLLSQKELKEEEEYSPLNVIIIVIFLMKFK